jgi:hypothetical protein
MLSFAQLFETVVVFRCQLRTTADQLRPGFRGAIANNALTC